VQDLNALYQRQPALYEIDFEPGGFEWIDCNDHEASVISLIRRAADPEDWVVAVLNWTPIVRHGYRVGVPAPGHYAELLNSDAEVYAGGNIGNQGGLDTDTGVRTRPCTVADADAPAAGRGHLQTSGRDGRRVKIPSLLLLALMVVLAQAPAKKPAAAIDIKNSASVRGKYVALVAGTNKDRVSPGGTLTLILRATPGPKMHVYAPGQQGYMPVTLTLHKDATYGARPVAYPASTLFEFAPLNEKVKVYDAPFTLKQDVTIAATADLKRRAAAGDTLTIKGSFAYQACDDTICYRPETLAVEWKIKLVSGLAD
jgi:hypothetical protein